MDATMPAGGGAVTRPRTQGRRRRQHHHQTPSLLLDVVLAIAARTDPSTLVRCAATCADARRRLADDPNLRRRLRPPILRGDLPHVEHFRRKSDTYMVDTGASADGGTCRVRRVTTGGFPVTSRDGLLLRMDQELRVCDPATGRSQTLPPEPTFPGAAQKCWEPYVLLVGDAEAGGATSDGLRAFQVLKANLVMSEHHRYLETQTFSSKNGAWGRYSEIRIPHLHGSSLLRGGTPMVSGGAVHWLCVTKGGGYVLKLHIRTAQVTMTALPVTFPCSDRGNGIDYLLATTTAAGGELMVLVADSKKKNNISAWVQTKPMAKWKQRPQVVMEHEAMLRFRNIRSSGTFHVQLHWFADRSGLVLFSSNGYGEFWLDLRSMEIVRWFPGNPIPYGTKSLPYEMDLSSWVPTFSSTII